MPEEKRPRGRPRKYATDAERKKAYRERKKAQRRELEIRVKELEQQLVRKQNQNKLLSLTYEEVSELNTELLSKLVQEIGAKLGGTTSLFSIFEYFLNSMHIFSDNLINNSKDKISVDVTEKLALNTENLQYLIIQYILNLELSKRKGKDFLNSELEKLDEMIKDLEEQAIHKKKSLNSQINKEK